jgi:predicted DnaQ family exonuclease/DinG family helicase
MDRKELLKVLNLNIFIAIDFETTGLDPINDRIIEIAAIKFENGEITDKYVQLINPEVKISSFITRITGISNKMIKSSPTEEMIIDDFLYFLGEDPLVGHNIYFDDNFLENLCKRLGRERKNAVKYDTLQLARSVLFEQPVFNLGALSEYFGFSSKGSHRAEVDTYNTGMIFIELIQELASHPIKLISKVNELIKDREIPNQKLYADIAEELNHIGNVKTSLVSSKIKRNLPINKFFCEGENDISSFSAESIFGKDGILKEHIENFEYRPDQIKYSDIIKETLLKEKSIGVVEAGTGLGKSMAYLYGAIDNSSDYENNGPTIIACHTKNLQDQLFNNDLPKLSNSINVPIKAVLLKGRRNYLCKTRFDWLTSDSKTLDKNDLEALIPILFWMECTKTGDLSECSGFFNTRREWLKSMICSEPGFCTGEICNKKHSCYYGKLKKLLFQANIIVVNHSLLMVEVANPGILPEHNSVIIDEAHNLVKSAYDQFKIEWTEQNSLYQIQNIDPSSPRSARWSNLLNKVCIQNSELSKIIEELKISIKEAKKSLKTMMDNISHENYSQFDPFKTYQNKPILKNIEKTYQSVHEDINLMEKDLKNILMSLDKIRKVILEVDNTRTKYGTLHSIFDNGHDKINRLLSDLICLTANQDIDTVYWMEGDFKYKNTSKEKLFITLHASLIDASINMTDKFFNRFHNVLLTSATLKVNNSFNYFLNRIGLKNIDSVVTKEFFSPFLYDEQVTFHQYNGAVELSSNSEKIGNLIIDLNKKFSKRMLVLFTSTKTLTETAKYIKNKVFNYNIPLFAQVKGASKSAIIKGLKDNPNGVVFGTNSFWEGVDFPGDLLEILILVKLPFDVPTDPLIKSYSEYLNNTGINSFMEYSLPECVVRFRQGFGRLIRTTYDSGKFICLDNRIIMKKYGSIIGKSIPVKMIPFTDVDSIN